MKGDSFKVRKDLQDQVDSLRGELSRLRRELEDAERAKGDFNRLRKELQEEIDRLTGDNTRLRREIDGHPREIAELREQFDRRLAEASSRSVNSPSVNTSDIDKAQRLQRELDEMRTRMQVMMMNGSLASSAQGCYLSIHFQHIFYAQTMYKYPYLFWWLIRRVAAQCEHA
jgi:chromosome segregation ATPase